MYPFLRLGYDAWLYRNAPLALLGTHVSHHRIRPSDIDPFGELNNGRALTLFDIGRISLVVRTGVLALIRRERWSLAVAGSSVRYRRRLRMFQRVEQRTRIVGWDARFVYLEQAMFRDGEAACHLLVRTAATDRDGIVGPDRLVRGMGASETSPPLPDWVQGWIDADSHRPWPPMQDG